MNQTHTSYCIGATALKKSLKYAKNDFFNFIIEKLLKIYIIGMSLERRLMVGQEILVLFIMVRIRALQPSSKH